MKIATVGPHRYRPTPIGAKQPHVVRLEAVEHGLSRVSIAVGTNTDHGYLRLHGAQERETRAARRSVVANLQ